MDNVTQIAGLAGPDVRELRSRIAGELYVPGDEGWDIISVTLRKSDLARIPESRVHTALEASTNCEVRIVAVE